MTRSEIRGEIIEMISAGYLNVAKIKAYFKQFKPEANKDIVAEEAKELVAEVKAINKRGY